MHINLSCVLHVSYYFLKDFIYLFVDRRKGREKERQRYITVSLPVLCPPLGSWPETQACAPTGNRTCGPLVHRLALSPQSHTSQGLSVSSLLLILGTSYKWNYRIFFLLSLLIICIYLFYFVRQSFS